MLCILKIVLWVNNCIIIIQFAIHFLTYFLPWFNLSKYYTDFEKHNYFKISNKITNLCKTQLICELCGIFNNLPKYCKSFLYTWNYAYKVREIIYRSLRRYPRSVISFRQNISLKQQSILKMLRNVWNASKGLISIFLDKLPLENLNNSI